MNVETPLGNQSPPKHVIQCKECGDTPKKCVLQSLARKVKKEEKITQLNIIFHPFAPPTPLGRFVPFVARRVRPPT